MYPATTHHHPPPRIFVELQRENAALRWQVQVLAALCLALIGYVRKAEQQAVTAMLLGEAMRWCIR